MNHIIANNPKVSHFSIHISNTNWDREEGKEIDRKVRKSTLYQRTLPPLDKQNLFYLTNLFSILSKIESQINLDLNRGPNGKPKYFISKNETIQPRIRANPLTFGTLPAGTNSDSAKLNIS